MWTSGVSEVRGMSAAKCSRQSIQSGSAFESRRVVLCALLSV
jgi:hypothetical protein